MVITCAVAVLLASACSGGQSSGSETPEPNPPANPPTADRCGDVEGAWSSPVDGLRGRILTSRAQPDRSSLRVEVELENVSAEPLAIHWDGYVNLGFVTFRLDDEAGAEVPEPDWRLGGNEPGGSLREVIPAGGTVRHAIGEVFARFDGRRILRIGAFWGREMPTDGARRFLRGQVVGRAPRPGDLLVETEGDELTVRDSAGTDARAWTGPLELPAVCID